MKNLPPKQFSKRFLLFVLIPPVLFLGSFIPGVYLIGETTQITLGIILVVMGVLMEAIPIIYILPYRKRFLHIKEEIKKESLSKIDGSDAFVPVSWGIVSNGDFTKRGTGVFFFQNGIRIEADTTKEYLFSSFQEIIQFPGNMPWIVLSFDHGVDGFPTEGVVLVDDPIVRKHIELRTGKPIDTLAHDQAYEKFLELKKQTQEWGKNITLQFQKVMFFLFLILGSVAVGLLLIRFTQFSQDGITIVTLVISIPLLLILYPRLFADTSKKRYAMNPQGFMIFHGRKSYGERWKNLICVETTPKGIICVFETNQGEEGRAFFAVDERFLSSLKNYPILVKEHSSNELDQ
ncbi:MAG: hypothetical protein PHP32_03640 [Candidatus Izemoplasmatales bacterium]|nr:hypothetical protein [Candidatus Izemoplasmatales bacterium]